MAYTVNVDRLDKHNKSFDAIDHFLLNMLSIGVINLLTAASNHGFLVKLRLL